MNTVEQRLSKLRSSQLPRMRKRAEFLKAASGSRVYSSRMTVQLYERATEIPKDSATGGAKLSPVSVKGPRFGLTVTKKTANAVGRNRIKRRLRAVLRDLQPSWPQADVDFVIVGRAELLTAPMNIVASDLKRAFSSKPQRGNPRSRNGHPSYRKRGRGTSGPPGIIQQNPMDHS